MKSGCGILVRVMAGLLVGIMAGHLVMAITFAIGDNRWRISRSPITGQCYESRVTVDMLAFSQTMVSVDDKFCKALGR